MKDAPWHEIWLYPYDCSHCYHCQGQESTQARHGPPVICHPEPPKAHTGKPAPRPPPSAEELGLEGMPQGNAMRRIKCWIYWTFFLVLQWPQYTFIAMEGLLITMPFMWLVVQVSTVVAGETKGESRGGGSFWAHLCSEMRIAKQAWMKWSGDQMPGFVDTWIHDC